MIPQWIKPALGGAALGAVATMIIGFNQGGWYTSKSANSLASEQSATAVVDALLPVCISQSKLDPDSVTKLKAMMAMQSVYDQREYVIKAGWATVSPTDGPNQDLAAACANALSKAKAS